MSEASWEQAFKESLEQHIEYVYQAGRELGVSICRLMRHDLSKWSPSEFGAYAHQFKGPGDDADGFARAWLHHIHNNEHHWQHWMFADGYTPKGSHVENGIVRMPNAFALEMVADWMGASMAYTRSWNLTEWLIGHLGRIHVHSETAVYLRAILLGLGYGEVVEAHKFASEGDDARDGA